MSIFTCARIRLPIKPYTATKLGSLQFFCVDESVCDSYFGTSIRFSRIPILSTVGLETETMCEVSFVLPSDILSYILGQDDSGQELFI